MFDALRRVDSELSLEARTVDAKRTRVADAICEALDESSPITKRFAPREISQIAKGFIQLAMDAVPWKFGHPSIFTD